MRCHKKKVSEWIKGEYPMFFSESFVSGTDSFFRRQTVFSKISEKKKLWKIEKMSMKHDDQIIAQVYRKRGEIRESLTYC